jgi:hypothetical protein
MQFLRDLRRLVVPVFHERQARREHVGLHPASFVGQPRRGAVVHEGGFVAVVHEDGNAADCDEHGEDYCEPAINLVTDFDVVQKTRD